MNTAIMQDPAYIDFASTAFSLMAAIGMTVSQDEILDIASLKAMKNHTTEAVAQARAALVARMQTWSRP